MPGSAESGGSWPRRWEPSCLHGFHGYLRTALRAQRQQVRWSRGWAGVRGAAWRPLQGQPWAQGSRNGSASSAGAVWPVRGGHGAPGEEQEGKNPLVSQLKFPLRLPPQDWGQRPWWEGPGRGRRAGWGTAITHTLSPGQLALRLRRPFCTVQAAGGQRPGLSSDLSPRGGPWVIAGRSRASLSGHWGDSKWLVSLGLGLAGRPCRPPDVARDQGQAL